MPIREVSPVRRGLVMARRVVRWLQARRRDWTPRRDRAFHDALFAAQQQDPFRFSYPGFVTIRRFADLALPHLEGATRVVDLGCGPGEITCELARRLPEARFLGVDHSRAGVERGREHAARLELTNVEFRTADVEGPELERIGLDRSVDVVTMFDAFHHLEDPRRLVRRLRERVARFVLVEPRGDWRGAWRRDLDLDWVLQDLDRLRARLEWEVAGRSPGEAATPAATAPEAGSPGVPDRPPAPCPDDAVEHRYHIDDLRDIFRGYGLSARGTVAGIEVYPPGPHGDDPLREAFGRLAWALYRDIDELLRQDDLDLLAKHWLVVAERGAPDRLREPPPAAPGSGPDAAGSERGETVRRLADAAVVRSAGTGPSVVRGPYDVDYLEYAGPRSAPAGEEVTARVRLRNAGWWPWSDRDPEHPVRASYHWLDADGALVEWDGRRSELPGHGIEPAEEARVELHVVVPERRGRYRLVVDLVHEGRTWFSEAGAPTLEVEFRVT